MVTVTSKKAKYNAISAYLITTNKNSRQLQKAMLDTSPEDRQDIFLEQCWKENLLSHEVVKWALRNRKMTGNREAWAWAEQNGWEIWGVMNVDTQQDDSSLSGGMLQSPTKEDALPPYHLSEVV